MHAISKIAVFAAAFAITANMQEYVHSLRVGIYSWHIFVPVIPVLTLLAIANGIITKPDRPTRVYYLWCILFLLTIVSSVVLVESGGSAISHATRYTTNFLIGMSFLALVQDRKLATAGALGVAFATIIAAGVSFAEFLNPDFTMIVDQRYVRESIKEGVISRVGGLHINPNSNARLMVLGMFVSSFFLQQKFRLLFCIFVGAAVFTTVSRSGILTWTTAMILLLVLGQLTPGKNFLKIVGLGGITIMGLLLTSGQIPTIINSLGLNEYMSEGMVERLSSGFFSQGDGSTNTRLDLYSYGFEIYADHPILGAGLGSTADLGGTGYSTHNSLLEISAELGTVGLLIILSLFMITLSLKSPKATCFMIVLTLSSMFAHGVYQNPALSFILPIGVILLSKLDQPGKSPAVNRQRKRRRISRRPGERTGSIAQRRSNGRRGSAFNH